MASINAEALKAKQGVVKLDNQIADYDEWLLAIHQEIEAQSIYIGSKHYDFSALQAQGVEIEILFPEKPWTKVKAHVQVVISLESIDQSPTS